MNRKMGQIDQISYFLYNKEVIICITPWNRDRSDETKRQVRVCQRHLRKFGFTPSEETRNLLRSKRRVVVIGAAAGARARLALPCPGCSEPQPWKAGAPFLPDSLLAEEQSSAGAEPRSSRPPCHQTRQDAPCGTHSSFNPMREVIESTFQIAKFRDWVLLK